MFETLVPSVKNYLKKHHELYSGLCKAEMWEELCCKSLIESGFGSDWKPDSNHKSGLDQTTDSGIRISNKSGQITLDNSSVEFSGSRLQKHKSFEAKLNFLAENHQDYHLCLSSNKKEWKAGLPRYYLIVIDSLKLDYHNQEWVGMCGTKGNKSGYICESEHFNARISNSLSEQLWTIVKCTLFEEIYEIII